MKNDQKNLAKSEDLVKRFSRLMLLGKVNQAIRLLDESAQGGVLPLTDETMQCLLQKHPQGKPLNPFMLLNGPFKKVNTVILTALTPIDQEMRN